MKNYKDTSWEKNWNARMSRKEYIKYLMPGNLVVFVLFFFFNFSIEWSIPLMYEMIFIVPMMLISRPVVFSVQRLNDVGRNKWNIPLVLIPIFGWIWVGYLLFSKGVLRENKDELPLIK